MRLLSVEAGLTGNPTLSVHVLQKILPWELVELPTLPANIQRWHRELKGKWIPWFPSYRYSSRRVSHSWEIISFFKHLFPAVILTPLLILVPFSPESQELGLVWPDSGAAIWGILRPCWRLGWISGKVSSPEGWWAWNSLPRVMAPSSSSSRSIWSVFSDIWFDFWVFLCGARSWTWWSLWIFFNSGYSVVLWYF